MLLTLLAACSPTATPVPEISEPTSAAPAATLTNTSAPTSMPTAIVEKTLTLTPVPEIMICSPLADHPIEQLPQIISEPFKTPRPDDDDIDDDGHHGVDFGYWSFDGKVIIGMEARAALEGTVVGLGVNKYPYGEMVIIETPYDRIPADFRVSQNIPEGQSLYTLYAHLQNPVRFTVGDFVSCGQRIGEAGRTGMSSGPHLHVETRYGAPGTVIGAMAFYTTTATNEEMDNYKLWRNSNGKFHLVDATELFR